MSIIIREARESDFADLYALFVEFATFQKTPERVTKDHEPLLRSVILNCFPVIS